MHPTHLARAALAATGVALLAVCVALAPARAASTGACLDLTVGPPEEIVSDARRDAAGLSGWPDGGLGILPSGSGGYDFFAVDAFGGTGPVPQRSIVSRGSLDDPLAGGVRSAEPTGLVPAQYAYAGGGPVYRDAASGVTLQLLHLERRHTTNPAGFWTVLGIGRYDAQTGRTTYLGDVVSPELSYEASNARGWSADLGMPSFTVVNHGQTPWFHFCFADFRESAPGVFAADALSVAGAPVAEVVVAARRGTVSPWRKLAGGSWSEPGLGGRSDDLQPGQSQAWAPRVLRSGELGAAFMLAPIGPREVVLSTSSDGIGGWSSRVSLFADPGYYNAYVSSAGRNGDPSDLGHSFSLYYTQWPSLNPDWSNARLMRRAIGCRPAPAAPTPPPATPAPSKPKPRAIRVKQVRVTWHHHRLRLLVRGRIVPPAGVRSCRGGRLRLAVRARKRVRLGVVRRVRGTCRFTARGHRRLRRGPRRHVVLKVAFLGSQRLAPRTRAPQRVTVRRRA